MQSCSKSSTLVVENHSSGPHAQPCLFAHHSCQKSGNLTVHVWRGNHTPGSHVATGCHSPVVQAMCHSSFQLTHMSRKDHAQSIESATRRPKGRQELITALTTSPAQYSVAKLREANTITCVISKAAYAGF